MSSQPARKPRSVPRRLTPNVAAFSPTGAEGRFGPALPGERGRPRAQLQHGWVIANHILVSFHVAFISSVLSIPPELTDRGEVLRFIFWSPETLVSAAFVYLSFHTAVAIHEMGHLLVAARLSALNEAAQTHVSRALAGGWLGRARYYLALFIRIPWGSALGVRREGLNYYPDAPYNLAVAAAGPRASRNAAWATLPLAAGLLAAGLIADLAAAVYVGRLLLGIGLVTLLDFFLADPGKYREFREREGHARARAARVQRGASWSREGARVKAEMISGRMQRVSHPRLGSICAPWQFRNCGMGGRHTEKEYPESNVSMQEAMFLILSASDYLEAQELTSRLQTRLKEIIENAEGCRVMGIGLEGGLAPYVDRGPYPLPEVRLWAMMKQAVEECGQRPGLDVAIALDPALSELEIAYRREHDLPDAVGQYLFWRDQDRTELDRNGILALYERALDEFDLPILSIEDGFAEDDFEGWRLLQERLGDRILIIGDDLVTTNDATIEEAADRGLINAALIKANQIGTLTETVLAMLSAWAKGLDLVVSHRSKSPNDDMEAQIAMAVNALGLKCGGGSNTERLVKYQAVTEQMLRLGLATGPTSVTHGLLEGQKAVLAQIRAYEEPTNAGIPTVGSTVEVEIPSAGVRLFLRGATPLGTSAGSGEAIHLVDELIEGAEHTEIIERHRGLFDEVEPQVYRFHRGVDEEQVNATADPLLQRIFRRARRYGGKGCLNAVDNVADVIAPHFRGRDLATLSIREIDRTLLRLEAELAMRRTKLSPGASDAELIRVMQRKQNLGMNATLSVSLALARAVARLQGKELFELLREEILALIHDLAAEHQVRIGGSELDDYAAALRQVEAHLAERGQAIHEALRRESRLYEWREAERAPVVPKLETAHREEGLPGSRRVASRDEDERPATPRPAPSEGAAGGTGDTPASRGLPAAEWSQVEAVEAAAPLPAPGNSLLSAVEWEEVVRLNRVLFEAFVSPNGRDVREALRTYFAIKPTIARRVGQFGIVNNRIYRDEGKLLVPYISVDTLVLCVVDAGKTEDRGSRRLAPGTIFTDDLIQSLAAFRGEVIDLEHRIYELDETAVDSRPIGHLRDVAALLERVNQGTNRNEAVFSLRRLMARLSQTAGGAFLGAKNLQPEIKAIVDALVRFLNGPFSRRLPVLSRLLVRNLSRLVGRPQLIDQIWNDSLDLAEVHIRGSAVVNELRRTAHHALGNRTLELATAYLTYLEGGEDSRLEELGFTRPTDADRRARNQPEALAIVTRLVSSLQELLGTSQVASRIHEWQRDYEERLERCAYGTDLGAELESLLDDGVRAKNRWVYFQHLRILRRKAEEFSATPALGREFLAVLAELEAVPPDSPDFDSEATSARARQAVDDLRSEIWRVFRDDLFSRLASLLDAFEGGSHFRAIQAAFALRDSLRPRLERGGFDEKRYYLLRLDCLLEEVAYLASRHLAGSHQERGVNVAECLEVIRLCVRGLELDGIACRELVDLVRILVDPSRNADERLNVLEAIERDYHKLRQRVVGPFEAMRDHLTVPSDELEPVLGNLRRYLHDLNTMVGFADIASSHLRAAPPEYPVAPPSVDAEPEHRILHISHRREIAELMNDGVNLRDLYGGKGSGLLYISFSKIPTRDGFLFPATVPRAGRHRRDPEWLERTCREHLRILEADLERRDGRVRRFGDVAVPLLVAVRSGSVFSMPGILSSVVFVGINDEIAATLARDDPWGAYDSYRRYLDCWAREAWGLEMERFHLVDAEKQKRGVRFKMELPWESMRDIVDRSKEIIASEGYGDELDRLLTEPLQQLYGAVRAVLESWNGSTARRYREIKGLCDSWQTTAIVQEMAFGNRTNEYVGPGMDETAASLTGVVPRTALTELGVRRLEGEFKFSAAGDDLVGGIIASNSLFPLDDLHRMMPMLGLRLRHAIGKLRRLMGTDQEVEFTVERGVLSVLQSRTAETVHEQAADRFRDPGPVATRGLGIRGGGFRGRVAFDEADLAELRAHDDPRTDGILMLLENPTPADIPAILSADGVLTARGGSTSHAAIAAHGIEDRPFAAVMSAANLKVDAEAHRALVLSGAGEVEHRINKGDVVSIHGTTGEVYVGYRELERVSEKARAAPESVSLLA